MKLSMGLQRISGYQCETRLALHQCLCFDIHNLFEGQAGLLICQAISFSCD